jgi:hypothetical protein
MGKNRHKNSHRPWSARDDFEVALAQYVFEVAEGHRLCIPDARQRLDDAIKGLAVAGRRTAWAVQRVSGDYQHPCIFGARRDARENRDADERVVQIEYRVLKVDSRTVDSGTQATPPHSDATRRSEAPKTS